MIAIARRSYYLSLKIWPINTSILVGDLLEQWSFSLLEVWTVGSLGMLPLIGVHTMTSYIHLTGSNSYFLRHGSQMFIPSKGSHRVKNQNSQLATLLASLLQLHCCHYDSGGKWPTLSHMRGRLSCKKPPKWSGQMIQEESDLLSVITYNTRGRLSCKKPPKWSGHIISIPTITIWKPYAKWWWGGGTPHF